MNGKSIVFLLFLLTLACRGFAQKIEVKPGTYYTNQKRVAKIELTVDRYGNIKLKRRIKAEVGKILGGIAAEMLISGGSNGIDFDHLATDYTFEAVEGMPNHYIERESQQGREYVTLLRVYDDYMLFSNLTSHEQSSMFVVNKVFKTYVIASDKSKVKTLITNQQFNSLEGEVYPKSLDAHYKKYVGQVIFLNASADLKSTFEEGILQEYKLGDLLYFRCYAPDKPSVIMRKAFPTYDQDYHYIAPQYEVFFDGKLIAHQTIYEGNYQHYNPDDDFIWQECIFTKEQRCGSVLGDIYNEILLTKHADLLTEGEHTLTIKVRGFNGVKGELTPPFIEGSIKVIIGAKAKDKTLSQSFIKAGMKDEGLESSSLNILHDYFPESAYSKVVIKSRGFSIVRHEISGVVLYRTAEIYGFGTNGEGCFSKVFRIIQDFNGVSYENSYRLDEGYIRGDYEQIPCVSIPK